LGLDQLCVAVNKMDLVARDQDRFNAVAAECEQDLASLGLRPRAYLPVSAREGDNVVERSTRIAWDCGPTLTDPIDAFRGDAPLVDGPLRIPVQGVYDDLDRGAIVAGTIESGAISVGDEIVAFPSMHRGRVARIEAFNRPLPDRAIAGEPVGFTTVEP